MTASAAKLNELEELWWLVHRGILALAQQPKPSGYNLDLAAKWLRQNGMTKDLNTEMAIREALASLDGLNEPIAIEDFE